MSRKRIPTDVQEAYAKLYGQRWEERLNSGPMPALLARAQHREWSNEIEARFANVRAERKGEDRALSPKDVRALAGEWSRQPDQLDVALALALKAAARRDAIEIAINVYFEQRPRMIAGPPLFQRNNPPEAKLAQSRPSTKASTRRIIASRGLFTPPGPLAAATALH